MPVSRCTNPGLARGDGVKISHELSRTAFRPLGVRRRGPAGQGGRAVSRGPDLAAVLEEYRPLSDEEARDLERVRELLVRDPWARSSLLHATGSAFILHPDTGRVLLRWHDRMQGWLHVGGHAETSETSPFQVALREAQEETGLADLAPWPDATRPTLVHVVIVPVPAWRGEPAHEHADFRYLLATGRPDEATPEAAAARLRWVSLAQASSTAAEPNMRVSLGRIARILASR
jgi:8-oxo-dGTP pyrophosphatase MutT (NUDIX family)